MFQNIMRIAGVDLQQQVASLRAQAEDFKDRTIEDVKGRAVDTAMMIGLAAVGGLFAVLTFGIGLIALYRFVGITYGPFWGLGAVALLTGVTAIVLFLVAMNRGKARAAEREALAEATARLAALQAAAEAARVSAAKSEAEAEANRAAAAGSAFAGSFTESMTEKTSAATSEALDMAADFIRKSPKEAVLASIALATVAGLLIGRRR